MTFPRPLGSWRTRSARLLGAALLILAPVASGPADRAQASTTSDPTWSTLSPATSPPALRGAAAAYDAANRTVVVFGGELPDGDLSDQTWVWNGTIWSRADQGFGSVPPARSGASMAYDSRLDQLILFGGEGSGHTLLDDTWLWNGASWIQVTAPSTPGARTDAALAPDPNGGLVLFGGYGTSGSSAGRPASSTSTTATTTASSTSSTTAPDGTSGTSGTSPATSAAGSGTTTTTTPPGGSGSASPRVLDDTWLLEKTSEGDDWVAATTPVHPAPTEGATAAATSAGTVLFGGSSSPPADAAAGLSKRTWVWSGRTWSLVRTSKSPPPSAYGVLVDDPAIGGVVAFGGSGPGGPSGQVWSFSGDRWQRLRSSSTPAARTAAAGVYDSATRQVLVFGGAGPTGAPLDSTVVLAAHPPVSAPSSPSTTSTSTSTTTSTTRGGTTRESSTSSSTTRTSNVASGRAGSSSTGGRTSAPKTPKTPKAPNIHPGDVVTLAGRGFAAGARVVVTFEPTHQVVAVTRANGSGAFRVEVTVPDGAAVGRHDFVATGTGPAGPLDLVTPVQVAAYTHRVTTSPATTLGLVSLAIACPVLTLLGLGVVDRRRRRPS